MVFILQVKNIHFQFSSKLGASGIFLFENITFDGQILCFMRFRHFKLLLLNAKLNFVSPIPQIQNETLCGSQIDLSITFEPVGTFA